MKIVLALICMSMFIFANEASDFAKELGYMNSYKAALQRARREHKTLMLVEVEDGCHWCHKFVRTTLRTQAVTKATNAFVRVIVDRHDRLPMFFQTSFVPVVFFIDPYTQTFMLESIGYHNKKRFLKKIDKLRSHGQR